MESIREAADRVYYHTRRFTKSLDGKDTTLTDIHELTEPEEAAGAYGNLCKSCNLHHRGDCY